MLDEEGSIRLLIRVIASRNSLTSRLSFASIYPLQEFSLFYITLITHRYDAALTYVYKLKVLHWLFDFLNKN